MSIKSVLHRCFHKPYHKNQFTDESVKDTFREIFWYFLFLITVNIVAFSSRSVMMYYFTNAVERLLLKRNFMTTADVEISYEEIITVEDWWKFMEESFINGIYLPKTKETDLQIATFQQPWFNLLNITRRTRSLEGSDHLVFIEDSMFLGPPRIRQRKVNENTCEIHSAFERYFRKCFARYSIFIDSGDNEKDDVGYFLWGKLGLYKGGGQAQYLKFDKEDNVNILEDMKRSQWIDRRTRLIVVEFNLYNANTNLFCIVKLVAELPPIGGVISSYSIRTFDMLYTGTPYEIFIIIVKILFFLQIVTYSIREIVDMYNARSKYFKRFWNWVGLTVLVMSLIILIFDIVRWFCMKIFLKRFSSSPDKYVDMDFIVFWHYHVMNIIALCAFLVWIQFFKYISFNKTMLQFSLTLRRCALDLLGFGVMFFIVFIAFAELGYLLFGTLNRDFRTMTDSIFTMMRTILGDFEYLAIEEANRILGPIFFLTYIFYVFFVLLNMFLAIINDTYSEVKSESMNDDIHVMNYIKRKFGKFCECLCCGRKASKNKKTTYGAKQTSDKVPESTTNSNQLNKDKELPDADLLDEDIEIADQQMPRKSPIFLQDHIVIPKKDVLKKLFREVGPRENEPTQEVQDLEPILNQIQSAEERLENLELVMDNFVRRMNVVINKLESRRPPDPGRSY